MLETVATACALGFVVLEGARLIFGAPDWPGWISAALVFASIAAFLGGDWQRRKAAQKAGTGRSQDTLHGEQRPKP